MNRDRENVIKMKRKIRKSILEKLKHQKEEDRRQKSLAIKKKLFKTAVFRKAKKILLYVGKGYEVDTSPIINEALKKGKRIFLPVTNVKRKRLLISEISDLEKDTKLGCFRIYEPKPCVVKRSKIKARDLDLFVVPGIAFDRHLNRLGHGAGYYDRFLKNIPHKTPAISLAFDFQVLEGDLPTLSYDIPVTRIITN